jgi:prophage regulatory protein
MPNTTRRNNVRRHPPPPIGHNRPPEPIEATPRPARSNRPRADADPQRAALRILRRPDVEERTGLRRSAIYEAIAEGRFPAPINIGPKAVGWVESEIDSWVAERIAARDERR